MQMAKTFAGTAVAFPGQGIQRPGMAEQVKGTTVWRFFEEASDILGYDLGTLCLEGPEEMLNNTQHAQPAVFVTCFALWELAKERFEPRVFLGHSLGEITALGAAGAFDFADGVRLTKVRGQLMAQAPKGGMTAVIGLDADAVRILCAEAAQSGFVQVANENSPSQTVVSGDLAGLEALAELARAKGAKRVVPLNVSGPFHSRLMGSAAEEFAQVVEKLSISACRTPVLSNDGETMIMEAGTVKSRLTAAMTEPVRFTAMVQRLRGLGIAEFAEVSPANLLISLARRIEPQLQFTLVSEGGIM